jgi:hypothetical protein
MTRGNENCEVISSDQVPVGFAVFVTRDGRPLFGSLANGPPTGEDAPAKIYLHPEDFESLQQFKNVVWQ